MGKRRKITARKQRFLKKTYGLFGLSLTGLVLLEVVLFKSGIAASIVRFCQHFHWGLVLGALILLAWMFRRMGYRRSRNTQYAALVGYMGVKSVLLVPLLARAERIAPGLIENAAATTLVGFASLTSIVWITRRDFSFLGAALSWGGLVAFALIVASLVLDLRLGVGFSIGMVGLAGGSILYDTSKLLNRRSPRNHVSAAIRLFASTVMMFWYVLRIFTRSHRSSFSGA